MQLRRRLWRATRSAHGNRRGLAGLRRPVWALRTAVGEYRSCGADVKAAGISPLRQLSQMWWSELRYHAPAPVVRHYSFAGLSSRRSARLCVIVGASMPQVYQLARAVSDAGAANTLADKRRFAAWCEAHALPAVPTVAEFEAGALVRLHPSDGRLPQESLFSKWGAAFGGDDTASWRYENGRYGRGDGRHLTPTDLIHELAMQSCSGLVLLQLRLTNHAEIARLAPRALSTVRVMTIAAAGESPRFLAGLLRMGTGDATADNFAQGGIAAPIDAETGELGDARGLDANGLTHVHPIHPDTGLAIAGTRIPFWRESVDLALRAHSLLGDLPVVGWDVAVTPCGPVLVEGNWNPCIKLLQVATQTPMLATSLATAVLDRLREPLRLNDDRWILSALA